MRMGKWGWKNVDRKIRKENGCFFVYGSVILNPDNNNLISINGEQTRIKSSWDNFIFLKKRKRNLRKQDKINQKRQTARTKSACVASPISCSPRKSPCFPTKEPGIENSQYTNQRLHSCNAGTLPGLWSTLLWKTVQRSVCFWDQKVNHCYTNGFLFYFLVFSNFQSKQSSFKSAIYYLIILKERGYHILNAKDGT